MNAVIKQENNTQAMQAIESKGIAPMVQMVASGQITIEQLDHLMGLQERHEATEAKRQYNSAMADFRSEVPPALRDAKGQNNQYATLGSVMSAINGPLGSNGFNVDFKHTQDIKENTLTVRCTITHAGGHSESTDLTVKVDKLGSANTVQSLGGNVSYLKRYTVSSLTGLATEDDDGQSTSKPEPTPPKVEYINDKDMADIEAVITELGGNPKLWTDYQVNILGAAAGGIPLMPKAKKAGAIKNIRDKAAQKAKAGEAKQ